jgi:phosphoribosylglycinamide formyltransferase-1
MTDPVQRIRAVAMQLPGAAEEAPGRFTVGGAVFARVEGDTLFVRTADADEEAVPLDGDVDWQLAEDRVARSWELSAPAGLLEAGGR